ncbi:MAG: SPFH domain-containing protein [Planctomycetota bacterium]
MDIKEKTALTTLGLNTLLTILKFVLFIFSGSLAVLAEAWHSFSDIATSFMVFVAIHQGSKAKPGPHETQNRDAEEGASTEASAQPRKPRVSFEQIVALGIGLSLLVIAVMLMAKTFSSTGLPVKNPLLAGLIFIGFSLGSYLVYRFESNVGRQENSVGLISDGMHARTDMAGSLITGFSLILYHLGWNIDRWVAGIIALLVLSFAIETIVNVILGMMRHDEEGAFRLRIHSIIGRLLSPARIVALGRYVDENLHIRFFGRSLVRKAPVYLFNLFLLALIAYWTSTSVFTVQPSEHAYVERFGRPVNKAEPLGPGLYFKAPWPMDQVRKEDTESIRRMNIGNTSEPSTFALLWTQKHGSEIPFLSGDNNYFYPYLILHYKITDLYDFTYRHTDPETLLENFAHQFAGKIFATKSFYEIVLDYREQMVLDLKDRLQAEVNQDRLGIEIVSISVKDVHPPIMIADSFEMVIASYQEKERMINEALGYRNQNIPETRGSAIRMRKEAESYALELPLRGEGDASQFLSRIPENEDIKSITQRRLWLSTMQEALTKRNKVIVDPKVGQPELWFNGREMFGSQGTKLDGPKF